MTKQARKPKSKISPHQALSSIVKFMDGLSGLEIGESQVFIFNNQRFVMFKIASNLTQND